MGRKTKSKNKTLAAFKKEKALWKDAASMDAAQQALLQSENNIRMIVDIATTGFPPDDQIVLDYDDFPERLKILMTEIERIIKEPHPDKGTLESSPIKTLKLFELLIKYQGSEEGWDSVTSDWLQKYANILLSQMKESDKTGKSSSFVDEESQRFMKAFSKYKENYLKEEMKGKPDVREKSTKIKNTQNCVNDKQKQSSNKKSNILTQNTGNEKNINDDNLKKASCKDEDFKDAWKYYDKLVELKEKDTERIKIGLPRIKCNTMRCFWSVHAVVGVNEDVNFGSFVTENCSNNFSGIIYPVSGMVNYNKTYSTREDITNPFNYYVPFSCELVRRLASKDMIMGRLLDSYLKDDINECGDKSSILSLKEELEFASYCEMKTLVIKLSNKMNANYGRYLADWLCQIDRNVQLFVELETDIDFYIDNSTKDKPINSVWEIWSYFRAQFNHAFFSNLHVILKFSSSDIPDEFLPGSHNLKRWKGEPLVGFTIDYEVLECQGKFEDASFPDIIMRTLSTLWNPTYHLLIFSNDTFYLTRNVREKVISKLKDSLLTLDYDDKYYESHFKYHGNFMLQNPLQPCADNLTSGIYHAFESDTVKYKKYALAIYYAIKKCITDQLLEHISNSGQSKELDAVCIDMAILGAGRGHLLTSILWAYKKITSEAPEKNISIAVHVVEKNNLALLDCRKVYEYIEGFTIKPVNIEMREWAKQMYNNKNRLPDIIVSELLGSFGCNELSPDLLYEVESYIYHPKQIWIPKVVESYIQPITNIPALQFLFDEAIFHSDFDGGQGRNNSRRFYTFVDVFEKAKPISPYSDRLYIAQPSPVYKIDNPKYCFTFLHPQYDKLININPKDLSGHAIINFKARSTCDITGFQGYFVATLYEEEGKAVLLSSCPHVNKLEAEKYNFECLSTSWFPAFFPLRGPIRLQEDGEFSFEIFRKTDNTGIWYEWRFVGQNGKMEDLQNENGINEENIFIASGEGLIAQFDKTEGESRKKEKVLRLITNNYIDEVTAKEKANSISYINESNKYFKFFQYDQNYEKNINIDYGIINHQMEYDKIESEFELIINYDKDSSQNSSLLGEVFFVNVDENGKYSFKMFGGIVEFKKSKEKVKLKTKKIHYLSAECLKYVNKEGKNNDPLYPQSCIPIATFVKITFLQHNYNILNNSFLKIYSLNVMSNVYNPINNQRKIDKWNGEYINNNINYYQSYTFKKNEIIKSIREDILKPEKTADGIDEIYIDYTKIPSIQTELGYKVEFNYELYEPINNFINFYPYASEINYKTKKESVRWIGLPCSPSKDQNPNNKTFSGQCHFEYNIKNPIIEVTKFTGIYYHPICINNVAKKCWLNINGVFINLQNRTTNNVKLNFKMLTFKVERFNLKNGKKHIYKLEIKNWNDNKHININKNKYVSLIKLTSSEMEQAEDNGYIICRYFSQNTDYIGCYNIKTYFNVIDVTGKYLKFKNFDQMLENNVKFREIADTVSDYGKNINSRYKIFLSLLQLPKKECNMYIELYVQKQNKEKKATFTMFIGMIKLNDFDNPSIVISSLTSDVISFSSICNEYTSFYGKEPNPSFLENCIPFADSLVIKFYSTTEICNDIIIKYASIESLVYDPRINKFKLFKWEAYFDEIHLKLFNSYKIFKESNNKGKIIDNNSENERIGKQKEEYLDYTLNSYLQKGIGYKVNVDAVISYNRINSRVNFFPAFSRTVIIDDKNKNNVLTWIGKPCTASNEKAFSEHGNITIYKNIPVQFECEVNDTFTLSKKTNYFNGIFYESTCLKKLYKDCWLNNFELLINFGDKFNEEEDIHFINLNYTFTLFDLLTGKIKTISVGHQNWKSSKEHNIKYNKNIGILRLYTPESFIVSATDKELNCKYSETEKRPTCGEDENMNKENIFKKVSFPQLLVSPEEIEIFGFNKNHTTIYDKQYNMYDITFHFTKVPPSECKILLEIFIVTFNKEGKVILELYGGIIELNQEKFNNNIGIFSMITKDIHFVDESCNNTHINNDECFPIGNAIKVTFMLRNNNICDNFNLKYAKILYLFKNKLEDIMYTEKEHEIIFNNSIDLQYSNTYVIYKSNKNTPVNLNIVNEDEKGDEEKELSIEEDKNIEEQVCKKNGAFNNNKYKKHSPKENEEDQDDDKENYLNNKNDNSDEDIEDDQSNTGKEKNDKNLQKAKKQIPARDRKNVGKKTVQQLKKKVTGGKKITSQVKGKKSFVGKKANPKKVVVRKVKPKPAPKACRKLYER
uniref:Protein arginine N-methyltransferase 5 n=1 Tax=Strongyloides stercoralis TaxID=6248 RepID=A0AAF5DA30_STRER